MDWVRIFDVGVRLFELGVGMFEVKVEIVGGDVLAVSIGVVDVHMPQLLFQVSHLQGSHLQMSAAAVMSFRDEDVYADRILLGLSVDLGSSKEAFFSLT